MMKSLLLIQKKNLVLKLILMKILQNKKIVLKKLKKKIFKLKQKKVMLITNMIIHVKLLIKLWLKKD